MLLKKKKSDEEAITASEWSAHAADLQPVHDGGNTMPLADQALTTWQSNVIKELKL